MIKRFVVFAGYQYYPAGGWGDFAGSFDAAHEAKAFAKTLEKQDWTQIIDLHTGEEVSQ